MTAKLSNGPMRRLYLFLAAFLLLAAMLCGCGPAPAAPTQPTAPTPPTAAPTEPTQPPAPSGDGPIIVNAPDIAVSHTFPNGLWCESMNTYTGSITLSVPEASFDSPDIHFLVTADSGRYLLYITDPNEFPIMSELPIQFDVPNHSWLVWERSCDPDTGAAIIHSPIVDMEAHTRIIIYDGEHIIGYVIMRYDAIPVYWVHPERAPQSPAPGEFLLFEPEILDHGPYYRVVIVESVIFPKIDGRHQDIPPEYIQARFDDSCLCWKSDLSGLPE